VDLHQRFCFPFFLLGGWLGRGREVETGSNHVAQAGLELAILLSPPAPPHLVLELQAWPLCPGFFSFLLVLGTELGGKGETCVC
jgi:hypothetical protein